MTLRAFNERKLMQRVRVPELMDEPNLAPDAHRRALAGLARINSLTRSANLLWPTIRDWMNGKFTVLDRKGLKAGSCECYRRINEEFKRLFG